MLSRLLSIIPALFLFVLSSVFIALSTAGAVMIQLLVNPFGQNHPHISLAISIMTALFVWGFLLWNHKLREYIKNQSQENQPFHE